MKELRGLFELIQAGNKAGTFWTVLLGSIIPALSVLNFVISFFVIETSTAVAAALDSYRGIVGLFFNPITFFIHIEFPQWLRDLLVFWSISGLVGMRAIMWVGEALAEIAKRYLPNAIPGSEGEEFLRDLIRKGRPPEGLGMVLPVMQYLIGAILGPFAMLYAWGKSASLPDTLLTPRSIIVVHWVAIFGWFVIGLATNWTTS